MAGTIVADTIQDGSSNSTAMTNAIKGSAKAWVTFNGLTSVSVYASYNVSSVIYNATAGSSSYTVAFTTPMPNANYGIQMLGGSIQGTQSSQAVIVSGNPIDASSCIVYTRNGSNGNAYYQYNSVTIFSS
jgi:hypothetical protein